MPTIELEKRKGYWWECDKDKTHWEPNFAKIGNAPLVKFFFDLAESGWDQNRLSVRCPICSEGHMFITYDFPRSADPIRLSLIHVVGLTKNLPYYLPMLWETMAHNEIEPWIDFKYVGQENGRYQSYGLSRPAIFTSGGLKDLFALYKKIVGRSLLD